MCGLAGFAGGVAPTPEDRLDLERMIATLHHRGPDAHGVHLSPGVGLAHARLSIIDLATGQQPLHDGSGSVWTVFNGEIFNFLELRRELERDGYTFRTSSDTEVIVHLYHRDGDRFVERLNGQFAIALWDARRRRLVLARDRAGIRPLYHVRARGRLWFASEVKALLAALPECARLDPDGLVQAFTFWGPSDPDTLFEGVRSLPPGHLLALEADGREILTRYWDWDFPDAGAAAPFASFDEAVEDLRGLLLDAVRLQLRADVPVGAYLSGGLDSSGIVALARQAGIASVRTFSVTFDDAEFDEREQQQAMVRHLGTAHTTLHCTRRDIADAFPALVRHTEAPVLRTAPVPLMLLSGEVRRSGYKVVLTGEGADEVFAGYDLFKEAKVRRFWARQPDSAWRHLLLGRLYGYLANSPVGTPGFARAFFAQGLEHIDRPVFSHVPRWTTSGRALAFLAPELQARAAAFDPLAFQEGRLPPQASRWAPLARDQYLEAKSLMAGYLLSSQGDRVAMANSIEGRFPFLDHRVIEFANRLPPHWKLRGLTEKHILRRALEPLLPPEIARRTKQPYRAPDASSFFEHGRPADYVAELLSPGRIRDAGLFDPARVGMLLEKCRRGGATGFGDNQAFVGILSTMLLHDTFIRRRDATAPELRATGTE
ncbi:asparagine synthase (glutamine-hydrolyzing) [Luteimonas sp. J29]|uniref:asparagine synthase (glutamine-hydrolyzing) n=1 Tax=Luteimonas sp. J29 TaxID=935863 RepID=UPI0004AFEA53|nr:asparagine synthase (glutamine-hydrolyzing) [Luteimonas sp. J29]